VLEALSTPHNRTVSLVFVIVCGLLAIASGVVGISDNPPGLLLAFLAATAFVLVFVHPWRTARQFKFLFYTSVLALALFAILHNVLEAIASTWASAGALHILLEGLSVAVFLLAVLVCPPAFLVGAVGWVAMSIRNRRRPAQGRDGVA
jgi:hypothetical protein